MVRRKDEGVVYIIEGFIAAAMMLLTLYFVLGTTTIYTTGDTHVSDMRFTTAGNDILRVMDTPWNLSGSWQPGPSDLETMVGQTQQIKFGSTFFTYLNNTNISANVIMFNQNAMPQMLANVSFVNRSMMYAGYLLNQSSSMTMTLRGQTPDIRMTHWVYVATMPTNLPTGISTQMNTNFPQPMLVEVDLWRS